MVTRGLVSTVMLRAVGERRCRGVPSAVLPHGKRYVQYRIKY